MDKCIQNVKLALKSMGPVASKTNGLVQKRISSITYWPYDYTNILKLSRLIKSYLSCKMNFKAHNNPNMISNRGK